MLKKLLSRDGKGKVAQRAKDALQAEASAPSAVEAPLPDPVTPRATPKPTPQVRRKTKSMRDSDIKDELGRSAEELAAESAKEFDIMGLAARVKDMPDAPDIKPVRKASSSTGTGEYGVIGQKPVEAAEPATPAPMIQHIVPEPVPVTALRIEGGHILSPGPAAGSSDASLLARDVYWDQFGVSDDAFLTPEHSPQAPDWPSTRQAFRIVRTPNSLIVASDGLSDPFDCFRGPADQNGYGQEVFIEVPGLQAATPDLVQNSWVFRAVAYVAQLIAHNGGIGDLLDQHGVMSLDVPATSAPRDWIVSGVAEPAGALLDVPMPRGRNLIADTPLSPVRAVPVTLIFPEELEDCVVGGPKERNALVNDLLTTGQGHKTDTARASLR
ncbi:MAG: hypothetical protein AAGA08_06530 [Pseudomonadota bacterium]